MVPNDGKLNGTVAGPRRFNVIAGSGNHPPKITSLPVLKAVLGQEYVYRITATDVDGDAVFFELVSRPDGALINRTTGRLAWTPAPSQRGDWQFIIRAVDAKGGYDEQRFLVSVDEILVGPTCRISSHSNGSRVSGVVVISGTAGKGGAPISIVQIRVDGGAWRTASGTENWSYRLDTTRLGNGGHAIGARAYDGSSYSDIVSVDVTVDNPVSSIPSWVVAAAAAVLVLAVAVAVLLFIRMRRKNGGRAGH